MDAGVSGPLFVSIGTAKQLREFLKKNQEVPRDSIFGDSLDRDVYQTLGLPLLTDVDGEAAKSAAKTLTAPSGLNIQDWCQYFTSFVSLSPIDKENQKFGEVPSGVLQLGGTFLIKDDDIVYQWNDRVPGDTPDLEEVLLKARAVQSP